MTKFIQKYTIVSLLEELGVGYEFSSDNWPLHITIADTFAIKWSVDKICEELAILAKQSHIAHAVASHCEYFGPDKQTQVAILDMSKELVDLHYAVVNVLKKGDVVFNDPQYAESGFRAHSTAQNHAHINIHDTVTITNLSLVDMFPHQDPYQRKILKRIELPLSTVRAIK